MHVCIVVAEFFCHHNEKWSGYVRLCLHMTILFSTKPSFPTGLTFLTQALRSHKVQVAIACWVVSCGHMHPLLCRALSV